MAKEKGDKKPEKKAGAKKRLHLHEIRTTHAKDGSLVHHHVYKDDADSDYTHPERGPMATSSSPEEAGQHVAEQFAMNGMGGGEEQGEGEEPGQEAAEGGAEQGGAPPAQQGE